MKKIKAIVFAFIAILLIASIGHSQEYPKSYWVIEVERSKKVMEQIEDMYRQWETRKKTAEAQIAAIEAREEKESKPVTEGAAPDEGVEAKEK